MSTLTAREFGAACRDIAQAVLSEHGFDSAAHSSGRCRLCGVRVELPPAPAYEDAAAVRFSPDIASDWIDAMEPRLSTHRCVIELAPMGGAQ